jgi:hypothetical protein
VDSGGQADRPPIRRDGIPLTVARVLLVLLAVVLLWQGFIISWHALVNSSVTFTFSWRSWLAGNGLYVASGLSLGLAALLPRRLRYRPGRALLLGAIPLVWLAHFTLILPASQFTQRHLHFLIGWPASDRLLNFESTLYGVATIWLGLAIAAGLEPPSRPGPVARGRLET